MCVCVFYSLAWDFTVGQLSSKVLKSSRLVCRYLLSIRKRFWTAVDRSSIWDSIGGGIGC